MKGRDDMEVYGTVAVLAALANISIGILTCRENLHSRMGRSILLVTAVLAWWGAAEGLTEFSTNEQQFLLWVKVSNAPFFILPTMLYYLAHEISQGKWRVPLYTSLILCAAFIVLLFTDTFIQGISDTGQGYTLIYGEAFSYFAVAYIFVTVLGFSLLYEGKEKIRRLGEIHRIEAMIYGFAISVILIFIFELFSPIFAWGLPRIGSVFSVLGILSLRYAYSQYSSVLSSRPQNQMETRDAACGALCSACSSFHARRCRSCFLGEREKKEKCRIYLCAEEKGTSCPNCGHILTCRTYREYREKCLFQDPAKILPPGASYRVESATYTAGRSILKDRIVRGDSGLIISREHPDVFFREWDLERPHLIWLSFEEENKWTINPTNLPKLAHMISNFIEEVPFSCVLFEGFEYLIIHNSFDAIMNLVYSLNDEVARNKCRFILSYDPRIFDRNKLAIMERELKEIPKKYVIDTE